MKFEIRVRVKHGRELVLRVADLETANRLVDAWPRRPDSEARIVVVERGA